MTSPFATYPSPERSFMPSGASNASSARGAAPAARGTTGAKRGRKPKINTSDSAEAGPSQATELQWMNTSTSAGMSSSTSAFAAMSSSSSIVNASGSQQQQPPSSPVAESSSAANAGGPGAVQSPIVAGDPGTGTPRGGTAAPGAAGGDEDGEGEDEMLPAMADDDYSAQLSWQSQSKDNLKVLMDNFSPAQYERFEAYRRHALPKQAVRKVIQQIVGQQVSQPVAQVVAGFAKVFVGEVVEKALAVQQRRGDSGPLSPDHLREAYRMYQLETGRVGAARPLKGKKLFVR